MLFTAFCRAATMLFQPLDHPLSMEFIAPTRYETIEDSTPDRVEYIELSTLDTMFLIVPHAEETVFNVPLIIEDMTEEMKSIAVCVIFCIVLHALFQSPVMSCATRVM